MSTNLSATSGEHIVRTNEVVQHLWISLDAAQSFRWANTVSGGATQIDIKKYIDRR